MPMRRISSTIGMQGMPLMPMPQARSMQSMAMREPTEISMPPVSMTQVMPQATQMRPAFVINRFRKVCR